MTASSAGSIRDKNPACQCAISWRPALRFKRRRQAAQRIRDQWMQASRSNASLTIWLRPTSCGTAPTGAAGCLQDGNTLVCAPLATVPCPSWNLRAPGDELMVRLSRLTADHARLRHIAVSESRVGNDAALISWLSSPAAPRQQPARRRPRAGPANDRRHGPTRSPLQPWRARPRVDSGARCRAALLAQLYAAIGARRHLAAVTPGGARLGARDPLAPSIALPTMCS